MPGKVLLDTNIVIALFSGEKEISEHLAGIEVAVPSIVLDELTTERESPAAPLKT